MFSHFYRFKSEIELLKLTAAVFNDSLEACPLCLSWVHLDKTVNPVSSMAWALFTVDLHPVNHQATLGLVAITVGLLMGRRRRVASMVRLQYLGALFA